MILANTIIRHRLQPDWGEGLVLSNELDGKIIVNFSKAGKKKLIANLEFLEIVDRVASGSQKHKELLKKPKQKKHIVPDFAFFIEQFLKTYPRGFKDTSYQEIIRDYKVRIAKQFAKDLSKSKFRKLIVDKDYNAVRSIILRLIKTSDLFNRYAQMQLANSLKKNNNIAKFSSSLYALLYNKKEEDHVLFAKFIATLEDIEAAKWPIATWFLFMRYPDEYPFLKPEETKAIAESSNFPLNYKPTLNWMTYCSVRDLYTFLKKELASYRPEDMIDVQSFIWASYSSYKMNYKP